MENINHQELVELQGTVVRLKKELERQYLEKLINNRFTKEDEENLIKLNEELKKYGFIEMVN